MSHQSAHRPLSVQKQNEILWSQGTAPRPTVSNRWKTEFQIAYGGGSNTCQCRGLPQQRGLPLRNVVHRDPTEEVDATRRHLNETSANPHPGVQALGLVTLVVKDYDSAIEFYCRTLGFRLVEDTFLGAGKRWVVVEPVGCTSSGRLLLAKAVNPKQEASIGCQTGGRVSLFLYTDNLLRDYALYQSRGVCFIEPPRTELYGIVVVFEDIYGNRWDLIEPSVESNAACFVGKGLKGVPDAYSPSSAQYCPEKFAAPKVNANCACRGHPPAKVAREPRATSCASRKSSHPADAVMRRSRSSQTRPPFCNYSPKSFNQLVPRAVRNDVFGYPCNKEGEVPSRGAEHPPLEEPQLKRTSSKLTTGLKSKVKRSPSAPAALCIPRSTSQEVGWVHPNHALTRSRLEDDEPQSHCVGQQVLYDDQTEIRREQSPSLLPGHPIVTQNWLPLPQQSGKKVHQRIDCLANRHLGVEVDVQTSESFPQERLNRTQQAGQQESGICAQCQCCGIIRRIDSSCSCPTRATKDDWAGRTKPALSAADLHVSDCMQWYD